MTLNRSTRSMNSDEHYLHIATLIIGGVAASYVVTLKEEVKTALTKETNRQTKRRRRRKKLLSLLPNGLISDIASLAKGDLTRKKKKLTSCFVPWIFVLLRKSCRML